MLEINTILFLAIVAAGAVVQTITGFAMGLIIMVGVTLFAIADIGFAAAVVSFISLVNASVALRSGYRHVDLVLVKWVLLGLIPLMALGLWLLDYLSQNYYQILKLMLGVVVVVAGTSLMISPSAFKQRSSKVSFAVCGALGGLLAGLYSAGGAPLAYFSYRQPLSINIIRFSLLAVFAASTAVRAVMIGASGQLNMEIVQTSALAVPLVILVTLAVTRYVHLVPDKLVRVTVFVVLIISGVFLSLLSLYEIGFS